VILLWGVTVLATSACSSSEEATDSRVVFCLSADQRPRLKDAAVTLGLAEADTLADHVIAANRSISLVEWRAQRPRDFNRACTALMAQRVPSPSSASWIMGLVATLNVLVGGLIGYGTARLRDIGIRAEQQGRALRQAATAFDTAIRAYLRARVKVSPKVPPETAVHDRRSELEAEMRHVKVLRPEWTVPKQVLSELRGQLGEDLTKEWQLQAPAERDARAERLRAKLDELTSEITRVAHAVEHPFRRNLDMRKGTDHTGEIQ
jgi:hypothetical protein